MFSVRTLKTSEAAALLHLSPNTLPARGRRGTHVVAALCAFGIEVVRHGARA